MIQPDSLDAERIRRIGFHVARIPARPLAIGAVVSRYALMVVSDEGRQVARVRCTAEGEYLGWGWVEDVRDGVVTGRTEYRMFTDLLEALRRHPGARARAAA